MGYPFLEDQPQPKPRDTSTFVEDFCREWMPSPNFFRTTPNERVFIAAIVAVLLLTIIVYLAVPTTGSTSNAELAREREQAGHDDSSGAWVFMQGFVEKRLKSPSTASFPWFTAISESVIPLGDDRYRVSSYVDAQNAFGATVRTQFTGIIKKVYGEWELEFLDLSP